MFITLLINCTGRCQSGVVLNPILHSITARYSSFEKWIHAAFKHMLQHYAEDDAPLIMYSGNSMLVTSNRDFWKICVQKVVLYLTAVVQKTYKKPLNSG